MEATAYLAQHQAAIEAAVTAAMSQAVKEQSDDPIGRIGQLLLDSSPDGHQRERRHTYESVYGEMEASNAAAAAERLNKYSSPPAVVRARVRTARRGMPYTNFRRMETAACLMELMHRVEERSATRLQREWRRRGSALAASTNDSAAAALADLDGDGEADDDWSAASWLKEQGVAEALAAAIIGGPWPPNGAGPLAPKRNTSSQRAAKSKSELSRLRSLGAAGRDSLLYALRTNNALDKLADMLAPALAALAHTDSATAVELHGKFVEAGGFEIEFGSLATFFGGLESVVGSPSPRVRAEMEAEHCARADSAAPFTVDNYLITTCSRIEWCFVVEAGGARGLARLRADTDLDGNFELGSGYPFERCTLPAGARPRAPLPLDEFAAPLEAHNARLRAANAPTVIEEEAIAVRLYTGPLFVKYNGVLRGLQSKLPFFVQRFEKLCRGNRYTTTLHALNSAIIKLSKLTVASNVYRGVAGGRLPAALRQRNEHGVRGGVDLAFMSASTDRSVALHYAGEGGGPAVALELRQGLVSRGADVWWLSQFPHEREVLFAPLTACEVRSLRAEGAVLVAEIGLALNLGAATLEQVIAKRRKLLVDMGDMCGLEVGTALKGAGAGADVEAAAAEVLRQRLYDDEGSALAHDVEWYNDDESFVEGVTAVVAAKNLALCTGRRAAGASTAQLLGDGFTSRQLRAVGCGVAELKEAGLLPLAIAALGFSPAELAAGGIDTQVALSRLSVDEIREGDYTAEALREAGWSSHALLNAGFSVPRLYEGGFVPMDLRAHGATLKDMQGVTALQLRAAGYTAADLKSQHMAPHMLLMGGFTKAELMAAGYHDTTLKFAYEMNAAQAASALRTEQERQRTTINTFRRELTRGGTERLEL